MPLGKKDKKMKANFEREYGPEGGERAYYATINKHISTGRPINTPESHKMAKKRKSAKRKQRRSKRKAR